MGWWRRLKKFVESPEDITVVVKLTERSRLPKTLPNTVPNSILQVGSPNLTNGRSLITSRIRQSEDRIEVFFQINKQRLLIENFIITDTVSRERILEGLPSYLQKKNINSHQESLVYEFYFPLTEALTCENETVRKIVAKGYGKLKNEKG